MMRILLMDFLLAALVHPATIAPGLADETVVKIASRIAPKSILGWHRGSRLKVALLILAARRRGSVNEGKVNRRKIYL